MNRYADPRRCPGCGSPLPIPLQDGRCGQCALPLLGPLAVELFGTLNRADELIARLREEGARAEATADVASAGSPGAGVPTPAAARLPVRRAWTVPAVLLTLGALCLVVAALVFLAVTWSALGVGGRTAVLLGFTALAALGTAYGHRRGLRAAAEALAAVTAAFCVLDVAGAFSAGWFGSPTPVGFAVAASTGLAVVAAVANLGLRRLGGGSLLVLEVFAGGALCVAALAAQGHWDGWPVAALAGTVLALGLAALAARAMRQPLLATIAATAGLFAWLALAGVGLTRTTRAYFGEGGFAGDGHWRAGDVVLDDVTPWLWAAGLAAVAALLPALPRLARTVAGVVAVGLTVLAAVAPVIAQARYAALVVAAVTVLAAVVRHVVLPPTPGVVRDVVDGSDGQPSPPRRGLSEREQEQAPPAGIVRHEVPDVGARDQTDRAGLSERQDGAPGPAGRARGAAVAGDVARGVVVLGLAMLAVAVGLRLIVEAEAAWNVAVNRVGLLGQDRWGARWSVTDDDWLAAPWTLLVLAVAAVLVALLRARGARRDADTTRTPARSGLGRLAAWAGPACGVLTVTAAGHVQRLWFLVLALAVPALVHLVVAWTEPARASGRRSASLPGGQLAWAGVWALAAALFATYHLAALALVAGAVLLVALGALARAAGPAATGAAVTPRSVAAVAVGPLTAVAAGCVGGLLDLRTGWTGLAAVVAVGLVTFGVALLPARRTPDGAQRWGNAPERALLHVPALSAALLAGTLGVVDVLDSREAAALAWTTGCATVTGAFAALVAIAFRDRAAAAVSAALGLVATWARLADSEVSTPEAYTLPVAAVLLGFGAWAMRDPRAGTQGTIGPGILTALVPSTLLVLDDPTSLRALLLGTACLVLVALGAASRWQAPLLWGAAAGAVLVAAEVFPYRDAVPRWLLLSLVGAGLLVAGIRWEWLASVGRRGWGSLRELR